MLVKILKSLFFADLEEEPQYLKDRGKLIDKNLIQYLSPLGWEHIHLTGDYVWQQDKLPGKGKFRPLRSSDSAVNRP